MVEEIAEQFPVSRQSLDLTDSVKNRPDYWFREDEAVIVGVPVYGHELLERDLLVVVFADVEVAVIQLRYHQAVKKFLAPLEIGIQRAYQQALPKTERDGDSIVSGNAGRRHFQPVAGDFRSGRS